MASPVAELLSDLRQALHHAGVRWYLFGAQAAILYGAARLTADVDVTADAGERSIPELIATLADGGFALRVAGAADFVARARVLPLTHERSTMPCDVVLAGPGIEDLFFGRVRTHTVEGVAVPVAAADDMVVMKTLAGRPKDLEDVASIVRAQGSALDIGRARATLGLLESALKRSDLLPLLDSVLARARPAVGGR